MVSNNVESISMHLHLLKEKAHEQLQLNLTDEQLRQFQAYMNLVTEWNEKLNLTAITEPGEMIIKHFLDSLFFVKYLNHYYPDHKIILGDLGTGAGFPGIPIKIVIPEMKVILIDSLAKRLHFLDHVIKQLNLELIETCHARAEDIGRDKTYRNSFDVIVARAVAELSILLEYGSPLLKVEGRMMAAKGLDPEGEVQKAKNAFSELNCKLELLDKYTLAEETHNRSMIIIRKFQSTPSKYPRQAGKPKKNPL